VTRPSRKRWHSPSGSTVRAWFAKDEAFVLLGTFRNEDNSQGHRDGEKRKDG
jgi:hypothetical protein